MPLNCPDDKILNPATGRCVKKNGALGKKLSKGETIAPAAPKASKECKEGKVKNPAGRCVKANSKTLKTRAAPAAAPAAPEDVFYDAPLYEGKMKEKKKKLTPLMIPEYRYRNNPLILPPSSIGSASSVDDYYRENPLILPPLSVGSATSYISPGSSVETTSEHSNIFNRKIFNAFKDNRLDKKAIKILKSNRLTPDELVKNVQGNSRALKDRFNAMMFSDVPEYTAKNIKNYKKKAKKSNTFVDAPEYTTKERFQKIKKNMKIQGLTSLSIPEYIPVSSIERALNQNNYGSDFY